MPAPNVKRSSVEPPLSPNKIFLVLTSRLPPNCGEVSETKSVLTVWNDESPLKNVDELAVPDPSLAVGTVPDAMFDAF